jgi:hypothetical protein
MKNALHDVISGKSKVGHGTVIQAITCYLTGSPRSGEMVEGSKHHKEKEEARLREYISQHNLWTPGVDTSL